MRANPRLGCHAPRATRNLAAVAPHRLEHHAELRLPHLPGLGAELTSFYNDAYIPIMGDKLNSLGRPFPEVWSEVWDTIGPITKRAMDGEASYFEDLPLTLMRRGYLEATWFSFSYSPIRDETGGIGGILCTVHETTERVRVEATLRQSEARLQAAIDLVDVSPYIWDPATGALDWDARLRAMWGLSLEMPVSLDVWMSGIHPEDRAQVEAALAHCVDPTGDGSTTSTTVS
jgi:PAS domain-containing protein